MSRVKNFLANYTNNGTRKNFWNAINKYFQSIYEEATTENLEEMADKYFSEKRDYEKDVQSFLVSLECLAPLTIKLKLNNIKAFLLENDIELPQKFWKKIRRRIKVSRALTLDRIPTNSELKKMLMHMAIQGKALFILLESSGMRIGESLLSQLDDLYLEETPARIQIRGENTKTGNPRHVFMSQEAKEALIEWLKVRKHYLRAAIGKSHRYGKSPDDQRIFPFDVTTAYSMWKNALHKSGLNGRDKSTNREKLHPHVLRKFFRTRLGAAGIQIDVVEALMGHEGYLTEVYRRYSLEDLRKFYLKGESALLVFTDIKEVIELQQRIEHKNKELQKEIEEKNTRLQVLVNSLAIENQSIKREITDLSEANKKLETNVGNIADLLGNVIKKLENLEK